MPDEKDKRSKMIFDALKENDLPEELYEQIGGWLLSGDNEQEKEARMSEYFSSVFDYEETPRAESYRMLAEFKKRRGIAPEPAPAARPLRRRAMLRIAAVVIPLMVVAAGALLLTDSGGGAETRRQGNLVTVTVPADGPQDADKIIRVTENTVVNLPDNSTVRLSKGSEITHSEKFEGTRQVELTGEAVFHVRKAEARTDTFTVNTDRMKITVLGTDFKVRAFPDDDHSTVDLYHGSVMVEAGRKSALLLPGEHLRIDHNGGQVEITRIPIEELVYDEMPGMTFRDGTLTDIFSTLETQYGVRFRVDGDVPLSADSIRGDYTGVRSIDGVMRVLQRLSGTFDYEIEKEEIIIKPTK